MRIISLLLAGLLCATVAAGSEASRKEKSGLTDRVPASYEELLSGGDDAWRAGDADRAMLRYGQAAQINPKADIPLLRMASIEESRKAWAQAHKLFELALLRAPDNPAALERLGFVLLREGDHESASLRFTAADAKDRTRWRSIMGLGLAAQMRGDPAAARMHFDAALLERPQEAELLAYSAALWLQQENVARALVDARASQRLQPMPATQLLLGDALARSADYPGALQAYLETLNQPEAYLRLGDEALRAEELARAQRYFQTSLDNSPIYNEMAVKRLAITRERIADRSHPRGQ
ncbi:MAG: hypothetical protein ABIP38_14085 [Steroidobacteraceae bacterium]